MTEEKEKYPNRFKKGQSGNPAGRPKRSVSISDILHKIGEEPAKVGADKTKLEVIMRKVYDFAYEGKPWAVQFIADRTIGRPQQSISVQAETPTFILREPDRLTDGQ